MRVASLLKHQHGGDFQRLPPMASPNQMHHHPPPPMPNFCGNGFGPWNHGAHPELVLSWKTLAGSRAGPPHGQPPAHTSSPVLALRPHIVEQRRDREGNTQLILQGLEIDLICLVVHRFKDENIVKCLHGRTPSPSKSCLSKRTVMYQAPTSPPGRGGSGTYGGRAPARLISGSCQRGGRAPIRQEGTNATRCEPSASQTGFFPRMQILKC